MSDVVDEGEAMSEKRVQRTLQLDTDVDEAITAWVEAEHRSYAETLRDIVREGFLHLKQQAEYRKPVPTVYARLYGERGYPVYKEWRNATADFDEDEGLLLVYRGEKLIARYPKEDVQSFEIADPDDAG